MATTTTAFARWRQMNVSGKDDAPELDGTPPVGSDLAQFLKQYADLVEKKQPTDEVKAAIVAIVERFWETLVPDDQHTPDKSTKYNKALLWSLVTKRLREKLAAMTTDGSVDKSNELVVVVDLTAQRLMLKTVPRTEMKSRVVPLRQAIEDGEIVLFSTTDLLFVQQLDKFADLSPQAKAQIDEFHARNLNDLKKLRMLTFVDMRNLGLFYGGVPLHLKLEARRRNDVLDYADASKPDKVVLIVYDLATKKLGTIPIDGSLFATRAALDAAFESFTASPEATNTLIVVDLRDDYSRFRNFPGYPALLKWGRPKGPSAQDVAPKRQRRTSPAKPQPQPEQPQPRPSPQPSPSPPRKQPTPQPLPPPVDVVAEFERHSHPFSDRLDAAWLTGVPLVDAAPTVRGEMLRLGVLAYQLAFEGRSLDSILGPVAGLLEKGDDVYTSNIRLRLQAAEISPDTPLVRTGETIGKLEALLATIVAAQTTLGAQGDMPVQDRQSKSQQAVAEGYHPYLFRFFKRFVIKPFGMLSFRLTRLRALLIGNVLGKFRAADHALFTDYEKLMAFGLTKDRYNFVTQLVEDAARDGVATGWIFSLPAGVSPIEKAQFTRDVELAVNIANISRDSSLLRRLAELYEILGEASSLVYGTFAETNLSFGQYLHKKAHGQPAFIYFSRQAGLVTGPPPTRETSENYLFKFTPSARTIPPPAEEEPPQSQVDENDDEDGNPQSQVEDEEFGQASDDDDEFEVPPPPLSSSREMQADKKLPSAASRSAEKKK